MTSRSEFLQVDVKSEVPFQNRAQTWSLWNIKDVQPAAVPYLMQNAMNNLYKKNAVISALN